MTCEWCGSSNGVHELTVLKNKPKVCEECLKTAKLCDSCKTLGKYGADVLYIEGAGFNCTDCAKNVNTCPDCQELYVDGHNVGGGKEVCPRCFAKYHLCGGCKTYHKDRMGMFDLLAYPHANLPGNVCQKCFDTKTKDLDPKPVEPCKFCGCYTANIHEKGGASGFVCRVCEDEYEIMACEECNKLYRIEDLSGKIPQCCKKCEKEHKNCEVCGTPARKGIMKEVEGALICSRCHRNTRSCPRCGSRHFRTIVGECSDCIHSHGHFALEDWRYAAPKFFLRGDGPLFYGTENEMGFEDYPQVHLYGAHLSKNFHRSLLYYVFDGSIQPRHSGVEAVTHPCSFDVLKKSGFDKMFTGPVKPKKNKSCGMHVHLSKGAFSSFHLYKFISFFYDFREFCEQIAQRPFKDQRIGDRYYCKEDRGRRDIVEKARLKGGRDRYQAVNLVPSKTVEVRIFAGATTAKEYFKNVEFCDALYYYTKCLKRPKISVEGFCNHVKENSVRYKNLHDFLKSLPEIATKPTERKEPKERKAWTTQMNGQQPVWTVPHEFA